MACVLLFDRTGQRNRDLDSRIRLEGINIASKVQELKERAANEIGISQEAVELIYCGQILRDDKVIEGYGIKDGCTVFAMQKCPPRKSPPTDMVHDSPQEGEIITALRAALIHPSYRQIVERMLSDTETVDNLIATTPGLDKDPVAIALLQDPELLAILIQPNAIHRLLSKHPSFRQLAITVAAAVVNEETSKDGSKVTKGSFSLDQMSDDEDESNDHQAERRFPAGAAGGGQGITASQLAAALAAATGATPPQAGSSTSSEPSTSGASFITPDFFQQAMMQAQSASTQAQLQQLRDMGIQDENRARQALQLTNGDIQAAIDLIFSDSSL